MVPLTPRQFIEKVASAFPESPDIKDLGDGVLGLEWENDGLTAGVWSGPDGAGVNLAEANLGVRSVKQAVDLLQRIFRDELVARAGFTGPKMEYCVLTPADQIGNILAYRDSTFRTDVPWVDAAWIRSWSGKLDKGGAPEWTPKPEQEAEPRETPGFWSLFFPGKKD